VLWLRLVRHLIRSSEPAPDLESADPVPVY
jgi:hypothetical protein